jgi:beta-galactosidase
LKKHACCVLCFVCLIFFCPFNIIQSAVAQGTTLAPSKRVVINLGETSWQFIKDQDPTNAQAPGFDDSAWQQVGIPRSADGLDAFINTQSDRRHFTMDPQYAYGKVKVVFEGAHAGAQVFDSLVPVDFTRRQTAVKPSCQELQASSRRSSA